MVFVSRSESKVERGEMAALEKAFSSRAQLVDHHDGFIGLELLRDIRNNSRYVLVTRWRSRSDFTAYMKSGDHTRAHERPHAGLPSSGTHGGKLEQFHVVMEEGAVNQFNPHAGETPSPTDPLAIALAERSAIVIWRMFPYFAARYGERGRSFGRSDAGYLVTLLGLAQDVAQVQVDWLARVLAPRGMPSVLLEYQLEHLGRAFKRRQPQGPGHLLALAAHLRRARLGALDASVFRECEASCQTAARGLRQRRGAGFLIAAAVADRITALGEHDQALVKWFGEAGAGDTAWENACANTRDWALRHRRAPMGIRP